MTTLVPTEMDSQRPFGLGIAILMLAVGSFAFMMERSAAPSLASSAVDVYSVVQKSFSGILATVGTFNYVGSAVSVPSTPFVAEGGDMARRAPPAQ